MTRGEGDEAAIRAVLGGLDPAETDAAARLAHDPVPPLPFDPDTGPGRARRRVSRRSRIAVLALPVALAGVGGVAVAWDNWAAKPEYADSVRCYSDTDLSAGEHYHGGGISAEKHEESTAQVLELCALMWREGVITPGRHALMPLAPVPEQPVPPLIACVVDGVVSALPALHGETCTSLKLRAWQPG